VLGALTPGDRRRYEAHLRSCPACRGEVASLAGLPGLLRRLSAQQAGDQP
jgi:anti-sigma factor RsiW